MTCLWKPWLLKLHLDFNEHKQITEFQHSLSFLNPGLINFSRHLNSFIKLIMTEGLPHSVSICASCANCWEYQNEGVLAIVGALWKTKAQRRWTQHNLEIWGVFKAPESWTQLPTQNSTWTHLPCVSSSVSSVSEIGINIQPLAQARNLGITSDSSPDSRSLVNYHSLMNLSLKPSHASASTTGHTSIIPYLDF